MYDVIVIGAGMAGLTAAIYVVRAGKSVLVLESGVVGGQIVNAPSIENWPGDYKVSGKDLMDKISHQAKELGVEIKYEEVLSIQKIQKIIDKSAEGADEKLIFAVKTDEGEYSCGAIIVATGTKPRELSASQKADAGERPISYCAICDGALYKDKPVVVVGSGNTAKQEIAYLEGICSKVYHIHHDDPIPEDAEAIFVAIGRVPKVEFMKGLVEMDSDGYIVADESCITSCAGIFAAGDCRTKSVRQLVTAAGDAAVAAGVAVEYLSENIY